MKNKSEWKLSLNVIAIVIGLVLTFTPSASTANKQAPKQTAVRQRTGPAPAYRSPGARHKVSVTDPKVIKDLEAQGASTGTGAAMGSINVTVTAAATLPPLLNSEYRVRVCTPHPVYPRAK